MLKITARSDSGIRHKADKWSHNSFSALASFRSLLSFDGGKLFGCHLIQKLRRACTQRDEGSMSEGGFILVYVAAGIGTK